MLFKVPWFLRPKVVDLSGKKIGRFPREDPQIFAASHILNLELYGWCEEQGNELWEMYDCPVVS